MKLLLVSDLHYALKQFDWIAAVAGNVELVVIAGDHLDIAGHLDGGVQIVVILNYIKRLAAKTKVIVSSGNHDLDQRGASGERVAAWMERVRALGAPSDGDSVMLDGALCTVCPWWDGPLALEAVRAQLARDAAIEKSAWLWVYHAPPEGSPTSWTGKRFYGDSALRDWIAEYEPDFVLTGHIHQAPFRDGGSWADRIGKTWVFNVGRQMGPTPCHLVLDTQAREAAWFSLAGAARVRLDASREPEPLDAPPLWLPAAILYPHNPDRDPIPA